MKKLLRILAWICAILLILIIVLVIGLKLFFPVEKAKQLVIEQAQKKLGRTITIDDVDISIWGGLGINLTQVTIGNPAGFEDTVIFLQAEDIGVKLQILPLLFGEYRLDRLVVNKPSIMMHKNVDGSTNYSFTAVEAVPVEAEVSDETKAAAAAVSFDNLEIHDGNLVYLDDSANIRIQLEGLALATSLENPLPNMYQSSGRIAVDKIRSSGKFPLPPAGVELRWRADYDYEKKYLTLQEAELQLGNLNFQLNGDLSHANGKLVLRTGLRSDRIAVIDLFSLAPPDQLQALEGFTVNGDFSFNADVTYDTENEIPLSYSGTAIISTMRMSYTGIDGMLKLDKALVDFKPDNLRVNIDNGSFDDKPLGGHLVINEFDDPIINAELGGQLDLRFLQPFLPIENNHSIGGMATFSIKVSGKAKEPSALDVSGNLAIADGHYASALVPEPIELFTLDAYFDNRVIRINKLDAATRSSRLSFTGRLNDLVPYMIADSAVQAKVNPGIDGTITGQINLELANHYFPPEGQAHLTGILDMNLSVIGSVIHPSTIRPHGTIKVTDGSYSDTVLAEPIRHFETEVVLSPDTVWINKMNVSFVSSDLGVTGSIIRPIPYLLPIEGIDRSQLRKPLFLFELTSHRFNVDSLFPAAAPGGALGENDTLSVMTFDSTELVAFPDIVGYGNFVFDTVVYSRVEFSNVIGKINIKDRRIVCSDVTGKVYSGDITGNTTVDLNNPLQPIYTGDYHATNIEADDFIRRFSKFGGYVLGKFDLDGSYNAAGWEPEQFLSSLTLDGDAVMRNGKMMASGSVYDALSKLATYLNQSLNAEQTLKNLKTKLSVQDGKVKLDKLQSHLGNLGEFELDGYYSFNNDIAYSGSILLSKESSEKLMSNKGVIGTLTGLLNDKSSGRIRLPFGVGGTIDKPNVAIDYSSLTDNLKKKVTDDAGNLLKGLIDKQ